MVDRKKKLVIIGDTAFAEIAFEYFTHDSPYQPVAFAVERAYLTKETLFGLPVVALDEVPARFPASEHSIYAAMVYTQLNRLRTRMTRWAREHGYPLASYVSSRAFVWRNVKLGEHVFIFEDNTVQPFVTLGDNVVLWSGNHIGHHSTIGNNVFIASQVVVSGFVDIGENTFVGVNATFANNIKVGADNLIGAGATILKDTEADKLFGATMTAPKDRSARAYFKVPDAS